MTDDQNELRRVNWGETFPFTHIFKSFKMAIHPSKLLLGLAAIILVCAAGWFMDWLWGLCGQTVREDEIAAHASLSTTRFDDGMRAWKEDRLAAAAKLKADALNEGFRLADFLKEIRKISDGLGKPFADKVKEQNKDGKDPEADAAKIEEQARKDKKSWSSLVKDAKEAHGKLMDRVEGIWDGCMKDAKKALDDTKVGDNEPFKTDEAKAKAKERLERDIDRAPRLLTAMEVQFNNEVRKIEGSHIVASLLQWERRCFWNGLLAVRYGNFTGGMAQYRAMIQNRAIPDDRQVAQQVLNVNVPEAQNAGPEPTPGNDRCGLLFWILMVMQGLMWFVQEHWVYAAIFLVFSLAVWSVLGGAIHRIAALQAAREEKISMGQAVKFGIEKFLSFFSAPLIPLVLLLVVGLFLFLGGLLGNIPWAGPILIGIPFVLAIVGGIVMAFLAIALAGGVGLMYPTIAVEGSDSFDAISRSISYIFQRPWHTVFYAAVMAIYGTITYLFVRFFVFLTLVLTHTFVRMGIMRGGARLDPNADELNVLWATPVWDNFDNLARTINFSATTNSGQVIGSVFIWIWVALLVGLMVAYLPSFFASATTVIYYLLRRKVDATDLDDVYVEEPEEEAEGAVEAPAEEGAASQAPPAEGAPAEEKPAEEKPAEEKPAEEKKEETEDKSEGDEKKSE